MAAVLDRPTVHTSHVVDHARNRILLVPGADVAPVDLLEYHDRPTKTILRLEAAWRLWETGKYNRIVVSGGRTHKPAIERQPIARTMAYWLIGLGVSDSDILVEDESLDTYENARFTLQKLSDAGIHNPHITVVSQWQHTIRFWLTFRALGVEIRPHPLHYPIGFRAWLLEWFFILIHRIDPVGNGWFGRRNRRNRSRAAAGM